MRSWYVCDSWMSLKLLHYVRRAAQDMGPAASLWVDAGKPDLRKLSFKPDEKELEEIKALVSWLRSSTAIAMQSQAEQQLAENEYSVNSTDVLTLTSESGCSAYNCEFISLAKSLKLKLITSDKKLIQMFPGIAMTVGDYLRTEP